MQRTTADDLAHIQMVWPSFELLVGLRGRKMYALVDTDQNTVCTFCEPATTRSSPRTGAPRLLSSPRKLWLPIPT